MWDGERQNNPDIYVKLIGTERPLRLTTDPAPDLSPAWSPDGRHIAFLRNWVGPERKGMILTVPALGGPERVLAELSAPVAAPSPPTAYMVVPPFPLLAWMPDGKSLVFLDRGPPPGGMALYLLSLDNGHRRQLTSPPRGASDGAPAVSPDGRVLVFARATSLTSAQLYRLELTRGGEPAGVPVRLTSSPTWNATPVWVSDGREIVFSSSRWFLGYSSLWRITARGATAPRRVQTPADESGWPAYSPQKHRLVFARANLDKNIYRLPLKGDTAAGPPSLFISSSRSEEAPQFSPDGSKIVFTTNRSGSTEVWVCDRDGSNAVQLTSLGAGVTGSPHWSPDGKRIVFDSTTEGQFEIYDINSNGGPPRRLTDHPATDALASFSRDGRFIYFSSNRTGRYEIWRMPAGGGNLVQLTHNGGRNPVEVPGGGVIYYERLAQLWKIASEGGEETKVLDSVGFINYDVTDRGIYFIQRQGTEERPVIRFYSFASKSVTPVVTLNCMIDVGLTVARDGRSLLYTQLDNAGSDLMLIENFR